MFKHRTDSQLTWFAGTRDLEEGSEYQSKAVDYGAWAWISEGVCLWPHSAHLHCVPPLLPTPLTSRWTEPAPFCRLRHKDVRLAAEVDCSLPCDHPHPTARLELEEFSPLNDPHHHFFSASSSQCACVYGHNTHIFMVEK